MIEATQDERERLVAAAVAGDFRTRRFGKTSRRLAASILRRWPAGRTPTVINEAAFVRLAVEDVKAERLGVVPAFLLPILAKIVFRQLWRILTAKG